MHHEKSTRKSSMKENVLDSLLVADKGLIF